MDIPLASQNAARQAHSDAIHCGLTPRETEVWALKLQGKNHKELAEALFISTHTVKKHLRNIDAKRAQYESEHGILPPIVSQEEALFMTLEIKENISADGAATELATLCKALNAYHIACGGNGLEIDDWETLGHLYLLDF